MTSGSYYGTLIWNIFSHLLQLPYREKLEKNGKKTKSWRKCRREADTKQCSLFHQTAD